MHLGSIYLVVKDYDKSLDFYEKLLDMKVTHQNSNRFAMFEFEGHCIALLNGHFDSDNPDKVVRKGIYDPYFDNYSEIMQLSNSRKTVLNFWHENLLEENKRLKSLNISEKITDIKYICNASPYFYFQLSDPDGNVIEVTGNYDSNNLETMEDFHIVDEKDFRLTDRDVRIVRLPSMTVASIYIQGQDENGNHAEYTTDMMINKFIKDNDLKETFPEARVFGFNRPDGISDEDPNHGYERWISIPNNMEVATPFVKKHFIGGLYAVHMIPEGAWDEGWMPLHTWVSENKNYDFRWGTVEGVCGWLEECLNFWDWCKDGSRVNQIDLLMPIQ